MASNDAPASIDGNGGGGGLDLLDLSRLESNH